MRASTPGKVLLRYLYLRELREKDIGPVLKGTIRQELYDIGFHSMVGPYRGILNTNISFLEDFGLIDVKDKGIKLTHFGRAFATTLTFSDRLEKDFFSLGDKGEDINV